MEYFSPNRPKLNNGLPMYLDKFGNPIAPLPQANITPLADGSFRVTFHLLVGRNVSKCFWRNFSNLQWFMEAYRDDPEACLESFGYDRRPLHLYSKDNIYIPEKDIGTFKDPLSDTPKKPLTIRTRKQDAIAPAVKKIITMDALTNLFKPPGT